MVFPWETKTKTGSTIRKLYRRVSHAFEGMVLGYVQELLEYN